MRTFILIALLVVLSAGALMANDIVTMPTANLLKAGEIEVGGYYLKMDTPPGVTGCVKIETLYVGVTNQLEINAYNVNPDGDKQSTLFRINYKVLSEKACQPDVVIGVDNPFKESTTYAKPPYAPLNYASLSEKPSFYLCTAKTFPMTSKGFAGPLVRVHLSAGTETYDILDSQRHSGIFGGLQFRITPQWGFVAEYDRRDLNTSLAYHVPGTQLALKVGTQGNIDWFGFAYTH
jgi:hypothetical protein